MESCVRDPCAHKLGTLKGKRVPVIWRLGSRLRIPHSSRESQHRTGRSQVCAVSESGREQRPGGQSRPSGAEGSRADPSGSEWLRVSSGAEWSRVEPSGAERSRVEPSEAEWSRVAPNLAKPATLSRADSNAEIEVRCDRVGLHRATAAPSRPRPAGLTHHFPAFS